MKRAPRDPTEMEVYNGLSALRTALLQLHKALVDSERITYESTIGTIESPNHFFQLVSTDPWFAWLHPVSELIVEMDERMDEKEPLNGTVLQNFLTKTRRLLVASQGEEGFAQHYYEALQRDPDVVLAHAEAARIFRPPSVPPQNGDQPS